MHWISAFVFCNVLQLCQPSTIAHAPSQQSGRRTVMMMMNAEWWAQAQVLRSARWYLCTGTDTDTDTGIWYVSPVPPLAAPSPRHLWRLRLLTANNFFFFILHGRVSGQLRYASIFVAVTVATATVSLAFTPAMYVCECEAWA
jgi:hypothetical protein